MLSPVWKMSEGSARNAPRICHDEILSELCVQELAGMNEGVVVCRVSS